MYNNIQPNDILDRRYTIIQRIAVGGMAEVFEAYDTYLERRVAIKMMSLDLSSNSKAIERFDKEYQAIALLKHRNIVQVYGRFNHLGRECIVLELVRGSTLKERLVKYGPCTANEINYYFTQINQAIIEAHANDIIHRDIKPENILISFDGKLKVTDFGVAIMENTPDDGDNKIIGTAKYLAPEIVQTRSVSKRSDIYALGVMLYELLTGTTPFGGKNSTLIAIKHVKELPLSPSLINETISTALENVILKTMSKDPNERYQTVKEFDEALKLALRGYNNEKHVRLKNRVVVRRHDKVRYKKVNGKYRYIPFWLENKTIYIILVISILLLIMFIILEVVL